MDTEDRVALHVALRGAVAQLQTAISLLMWRSGGSRNEEEQAFLGQAKLALDALTRLEETAPPAPTRTARELRDGIRDALVPKALLDDGDLTSAELFDDPI